MKNLLLSFFYFIFPACNNQPNKNTAAVLNNSMYNKEHSSGVKAFAIQTPKATFTYPKK